MAYTQAEYRGRNDDGSESTATWKAAANTSWTQDVGENFRVRARVSRATSVADGVFAWQYSEDNVAWSNMPPEGTLGVPVRFAASANLTDRAATTQQLGSGTFVAGRQFESNRSGGIGMNVGSEAEPETHLCRYQDGTFVDGHARGWSVKVLRSGRYAITYLRGEYTGDVTLATQWQGRTTRQPLAAGTNRATIDVPAGDGTLDIWIESSDGARLPFTDNDTSGDAILRRL